MKSLLVVLLVFGFATAIDPESDDEFDALFDDLGEFL